MELVLQSARWTRRCAALRDGQPPGIRGSGKERAALEGAVPGSRINSALPANVSQHPGVIIISSRPAHRAGAAREAAMKTASICQWTKTPATRCASSKSTSSRFASVHSWEECVELIALRTGTTDPSLADRLRDPSIYDRIFCAGDTDRAVPDRYPIADTIPSEQFQPAAASLLPRFYSLASALHRSSACAVNPYVRRREAQRRAPARRQAVRAACRSSPAPAKSSLKRWE